MKRRQLLKATAAGAVVMTAPSVLRAQNTALKVGTYGGYFQNSFEKYIYPDFTAATGIAIESIAEPTGEAWLIQLRQAARARQAPADVSMMARVARLKGARAGLWAGLDDRKMPNAVKLPDHFIYHNDKDELTGVGAVGWYITLVTNTDSYPDAPNSWKSFWDPANADKLGLMSLASNSYLLEITATTFFGGGEILETNDGVLQVMDKLAEVKSNVRLWWRDEGQFQQALETGEIPMGQYYHDVTGLAAGQGKPVRSTFPDEGAVLDSGTWVVSRASKMVDPAQIFIDYMAQPEIQAKLSRKVGSAPMVPREMTDLTDEEFAAVSSDKEAILPMVEMYADRADWINQMWSEKITG